MTLGTVGGSGVGLGLGLEEFDLVQIFLSFDGKKTLKEIFKVFGGKIGAGLKYLWCFGHWAGVFRRLYEYPLMESTEENYKWGNLGGYYGKLDRYFGEMYGVKCSMKEIIKTFDGMHDKDEIIDQYRISDKIYNQLRVFLDGDFDTGVVIYYRQISS